jgi:hypothetical protein
MSRPERAHSGAKINDSKIILSYVVICGLILIALYFSSAGKVPDGTDFSTTTVFP